MVSPMPLFGARLGSCSSQMTAEPLPKCRCKRDLHGAEASAESLKGFLVWMQRQVQPTPQRQMLQNHQGHELKVQISWVHYTETSPSASQISSQSSSRGGSSWSCLKNASFLLHPVDPPLPSLLRQSEVISPSEKLLLETNPSICSGDFFLP